MAVMGPGGMVKKLKTLEEQQETMENDMTTAKDMIWRLSNRINALEKEVKYLRTCVDNKDKESTNSHNSVAERRSSRISETAKRRSYSEELQIVKTEPDKIEDGGESDNISILAAVDQFLSNNSEGIDTAESSAINTPSALSKAKRRRRNSDGSFNPNSDSDSHSGDDKKRKNQNGKDIKPRVDSSIWKNFDVKTFPKESHVGRKRQRKIVTCKFCKQKVSPRQYRLKAHMDKCAFTVLKDSDEGAKHSSVEGTNSVSTISEDRALVKPVDGTLEEPLDDTLRDANISDGEK